MQESHAKLSNLWRGLDHNHKLTQYNWQLCRWQKKKTDQKQSRTQWQTKWNDL